MATDITYTTSGSGVFTEDFSLDLYAGTPTTDTEWLKGGASAAYPGNLDGFLAKNAEAAPATKGMKLVCGRITTVLVNDETITVTGGASRILAVLCGDTSTAASSLALKAGHVLPAAAAQFTVVGTQWVGVTMWMIVA